MSAIFYRRRAVRMLRVAFALSLLLHLTAGALYGFLAGRFPRLRALTPQPRPTEVFVTLSDALTFDKRPHLRSSRGSHARVVRVRPLPVRVAMAPSTTVTHTLQPQPPRVEHAPTREAPQTHAPALSRTQIQRLTADFARTIIVARSAENPLRVTRATPAALVKRYPLQIAGRIGTLRVGQGLLTPIKKWSADGYTYYYVNYELVWPDGTYESGAVPWPIRYLPSEDPFADDRPRRIPLPPPLPGWMLPPGIPLGKVLREYFPQNDS